MMLGYRMVSTSWAAGAAALLGLLVWTTPVVAQDADLYGPSPQNASQGGTIAVASIVEPPGLDPFHQGADARIQISVLMYQGLMYEDPSGTAKPLLAESYSMSPDGLKYTFKLRQGVTFHNGKPMTAADVKYSYDYIRDPKNGSPGAGDFQTIKAIIVVDDHTVEFHLSTPNAALPMTVTNKYGGVIPKDYFAAQNAGAAMNQRSVGTGPFKLKAFQPNSLLALERHAGYWQKDRPYLDGITFLFLPNSASMLVALRNKRVDLAVLGRPQDAQQLKGAEGLTVKRWPSLKQQSLDLDRNYGPLKDVKVRQAIAATLDKNAIMQAAVGGYGRVLGTIPAAMQEAWGAPLDQLAFQKPDLEKARALMLEAGLGAGVAVDLTIINGYDWMDPAAVTLAEQLRPIGVQLNVKKLDLGVWINAFRSRNMGFTFNDWSTPPDPHLLFYRHFHMQPEGADFRNWGNVGASQLLDQGMRESDPAKRRAAYVEFQKVLAEDVPTIMMFGADLVTVSTEKVKSYTQHPSGWYFGLINAHVN
jgi:peptide/nickel transport system substrate-binding protein